MLFYFIVSEVDLLSFLNIRIAVVKQKTKFEIIINFIHKNNLKHFNQSKYDIKTSGSHIIMMKINLWHSCVECTR